MIKLNGNIPKTHMHMRQNRLRLATNSMLVGALAAASALLIRGPVATAACAAPSTDYGSVTSTVSVPGTAMYRIWSHMNVPSSSANTYRLQVDGGTCFEVGGAGLAANVWTWVGWQNGNKSSFTSMSLSAGNHSLKLIGDAAGVRIDKLVLSSDANCVPTGDGGNCNTPSDTTPPAVRLSAPVSGSTVGGTVTVAATATDASGVSKVEFYDNSSLIGTDTTSPYSTSWATASLPNGTHTVTAKAYDTAGNASTDGFTVDVENGDREAPTTPSGLSATATAYNKVSVSWKASTDNVGVKGYTLYRDTVPIATVGGTGYTDTVAANTSYAYQVQAYDAAGNKSAESAKVTVKTPSVADTQPPSVPTALSAVVISSHQINLSWKASTDNIGVTGYDIYRGSQKNNLKKVASSITASFGDTDLSPSATYVYAVVAKDANGNSSSQSGTISARTPSATAGTLAFPITTTPGASGSGVGASSGSSGSTSLSTTANPATINPGLTVTDKPLFNYIGQVTDGKHKPVPYATVIITYGSNRHIFQADSHGRYAVFGLLADRYNITYRSDDFLSKTVEVHVSADVTKNMELQHR